MFDRKRHSLTKWCRRLLSDHAHSRLVDADADERVLELRSDEHLEHAQGPRDLTVELLEQHELVQRFVPDERKVTFVCDRFIV